MVNSKMMAVVGAVIVSVVAYGETYSWRHIKNNSNDVPPASPNWQSFSESANWVVGEPYYTGNSNGSIPSSGDDIYFGRYSDYTAKVICLDLAGGTHSVQKLLGGGDQWVPYLMLIKNGTLGFYSSFNNNSTHVHVYDGGKFVHGSLCTSKWGSTGIYTLMHAHEGGEIDIEGNIEYTCMSIIADAGATVTFNPAKFKNFFGLIVDHGSSVIRNYGTFNLPNGFVLDAQWSNPKQGTCYFTFEQKGGTLNVGGDFAKTEEVSGETYNLQVQFYLEGGVVNVTEDSAFSGFKKVVMTDAAAVIVNVAEGKTFDLSKMVFNAGTKLVKRGAGTVKFGASLPESLSVEEGSFVLGTNKKFNDFSVNVGQGETLDLSAVTFEEGAVFTKSGAGTVILGSSTPDVLNIEGGKVDVTKAVSFASISFAEGAALHIAAHKVSAKKVYGAENALITVNDEVLAKGLPFFSVEDENVAKILSQKIETPAGFAGVGNAGELTVEKIRDPTVFYWKNENNSYYWDFYDPSSWGVGETADSENADRLIPGEDDEISYCTRTDIWAFYLRFNMQGGARWVKSFKVGNVNIWSKRILEIKNGFLGFNSVFKTVWVPVTVSEGGIFALGENCSSRFGYQGNKNSYEVEATGKVDIKGDVLLQYMTARVQKGGIFSFAPRTFTYDSQASRDMTSYIANSGSCSFSNGFVLKGQSLGNCTFSITQCAGEMVLGGDVKMESTVDHLDFNLAGGVVRVTGDAAFIGCRNVVMANDAVAEVSVAAEKTADFSAMEFGAGTELTKTGAGALKLGSSLPGSLSVAAGELVLAGAANLGSSLALAEGVTLRFASVGIAADAIEGAENANFAVDASVLANGAVLVSSTNRELLETIAAKLAAEVNRVSSARRGVTVTADSNGGYALSVFATKGLKIFVK